jgi:hypothetical protein
MPLYAIVQESPDGTNLEQVIAALRLVKFRRSREALTLE